jgi:hypothetical protein
MGEFRPPITIFFIWHPADEKEIVESIEFCFRMLKRDINRPFSRSLNLPVFFRTSSTTKIPAQFESISIKTLVFILVSKHIVADKEWTEYIEKIPNDTQCKVIPIALDNTAFNLESDIKQMNFIRAYSFEKGYFKENLLVSVTHEIYRLALNENYREISRGDETAIELFISHAKDGKQGITIATKLKDFIDNTHMNNFFDTTDIAPGYKFNEEIIGHIKESTLIAIHSDPYSSRYWCQREIQCAKENDRPIIAVDCLEDYEDRRFPLATNIPGVHLHLDENSDVKRKDLYRVIITSLVETVRYYYAKQLLVCYKESGWFPSNSIILARPPEFTDLVKLKEFYSPTSDPLENKENFVYPEPPVYQDELTVFNKLGIKPFTPLNAPGTVFSDFKIGISISDPSSDELIEIGQNSSHLTQLSQDIARHLIARKNLLIYGGDLRPDGFTEFLLREAQALQTRINNDWVFIKNFVAWPIFENESASVTDWIANNKAILDVEKISPSEDVVEMIPNINAFLSPTTTENSYIWSRCLSKMREIMISECDIRICAGGRHSGYKGRMPGVLEEIIIAVEKEKPIYLLGGFGGIVQSVCSLIEEGNLPEKLTNKWQSLNNAGYNSLLKFIHNKKQDYLPQYESLLDSLDIKNLRNGLNDEENRRLFSSPYIDEVIHLIINGIRRLDKRANSNGKEKKKSIINRVKGIFQ